MLNGCTKSKPVYEPIAENATNTITAIEKSLPKECQTDANSLLFNVARKEIINITTACNTEVDKVGKEKLKWKLSFWVLIGLMGAYILKKISK